MIKEIGCLLGVNRVVEPAGEAWRNFDFPQEVLCSVRFGAHHFELGETMQIVPVRRDERRETAWPARKRKPAAHLHLRGMPRQHLRNLRSWFNV